MTFALPGAHVELAAVAAAEQRVVIITAKTPLGRADLCAVGLSADGLFSWCTARRRRRR